MAGRGGRRDPVGGSGEILGAEGLGVRIGRGVEVAPLVDAAVPLHGAQEVPHALLAGLAPDPLVHGGAVRQEEGLQGLPVVAVASGKTVRGAGLKAGCGP